MFSEATPEQISHSFMEKIGDNQPPDLSLVERLCEAALCRDNADLRRAAVVAIYKNIIEPLCDDFSAQGVGQCNLVLLRMLSVLRRKEEGRALNELLDTLGLHDEGQFLSRYHRMKTERVLPGDSRDNVRKILVLSRVTVGADVAITSILVHRLLVSFPQAELLVFGPQHLAEIFSGLARVHWAKVHYQRDGGLVGRLVYFTSLYRLIEKERHGFPGETILFFDPDTRLSQLGLLPMSDESQYCYFPSREIGFNTTRRLSRLANDWLNQLLSEDKQVAPQISIRPVHQLIVNRFFAQLPPGTRKIVINFGVGNDSRKRIDDPFEEKLLISLLEQEKAMIVLDSGSHPNERERATQLIEKMKTLGFATLQVSEKDFGRIKPNFRTGIVCVQGGIGLLSALIDQADAFFGYDSCCQHLATARKTRSVICFAGAINDRFYSRWQPLDNDGRTTTVRMHETTGLSPDAIQGLADKFARLVFQSADQENRKGLNS